MSAYTHLVNQTYLMTRRDLLTFFRSPPHVISSIVFPGLLLFFFFVMFNGAVGNFGDESYINRLVSGMILTSVTFGSIASAIDFKQDMNSAFFQRIKTFPFSYTSFALSKVSFEIIRSILSTAVIVILGYFMGFEFFEISVIPVYFMIVALASLTIVWISLSLAVFSKTTEMVTTLLNVIFLFMVFTSLGMVPLGAFPKWINTWVLINPLSIYSELMRGLSMGNSDILNGKISACLSMFSISVISMIIFSIGFNKRIKNI